MNLDRQQKGVVIVGANPTGLLLAARLLNFGLEPVIIDSRSSYSEDSPTFVLDFTSLEIFSQLGLSPEIIREGTKLSGFQVRYGDELLNAFVYGENKDESEFSYNLSISQNKLEDILIKYLAGKACPIHWDVKVSNFKEDVHGIELEILKEQEVHNWNVSWLVVADKKQLAVEPLLSIGYNTWSFGDYLFRLVIKTDVTATRNQLLFLYKNSFVMSSPVDYKGTYEFEGSFANRGDEAENLRSIKKLLSGLFGSPTSLQSHKRINILSARSHIASQYIKGHSVLLGDAAFSQISTLGDGINIGIHDAYNLAWKLANVVRGKQSESILSSYEEERRSFSQKRHENGYKIYFLFKVYNYLPRIVQQKLIPRLFRKRWLSAFTDYRKKSLSLSHTLGRKVQPGDRMPFIYIYDEKRDIVGDLHQWCRKPGFTLLLLGNLSSHSLFVISQWIKQKYTQYMHLFYLPYSKQNAAVFTRFEVHPEKNKMILIRPDMHIGYMHDVVSANLIDTYMVEVMKWRF